MFYLHSCGLPSLYDGDGFPGMDPIGTDGVTIEIAYGFD